MYTDSTVCIFLGAASSTHRAKSLLESSAVADVCFPNRLTEQAAGEYPASGWSPACFFWEFYSTFLISHRIASQRLHRSGFLSFRFVSFRFLHKNKYTRKEIYFVPPSAPPIELIIINTHCTKRLDDRRDPCLSLGRWLLFVIFKERRKPGVSPNLELPIG
jgi:hypothetical protein